jgi:hypothetical protein
MFCDIAFPRTLSCAPGGNRTPIVPLRRRMPYPLDHGRESDSLCSENPYATGLVGICQGSSLSNNLRLIIQAIIHNIGLVHRPISQVGLIQSLRKADQLSAFRTHGVALTESRLLTN